MYTLQVKGHFDAGHWLYHYDGKCRNKHGHSWSYILFFQGEELDKRGILIDFVDIKAVMKAVIDEEFDHKMLNEDVDYFKLESPTAENIAKYIYDKVKFHLPQLDEVSVYESPECGVTYRP